MPRGHYHTGAHRFAVTIMFPSHDMVELVDLDTLLIDLSEEQGSEFSRNVLEV